MGYSTSPAFKDHNSKREMAAAGKAAKAEAWGGKKPDPESRLQKSQYEHNHTEL